MRSLFHFMNWPLRAKMAVIFVIISLLPLGIATLINIRETRARMVDDEGHLLAARADHLVAQLDVFNRSYQRTVDQVAHLPGIVDYFASNAPGSGNRRDIAYPLLDVWPAGDANIRGVALLDTSGKVRLATEDLLTDADLSHYGFVRKAISGVPATSNIYLAESVTGDTPTIAFLAPVNSSENKFIGLVAFWVRAQALWDIMRTSNELAGSGSYAVLLDNNGIRMGYTYSAEMVFRPAGHLDPATVDSLVAARRFGENTRRFLEDVRPFPEQFERALSNSPDNTVFKAYAAANQMWNYGVARRFESVQWTIFYMVPEQSLNAQIAEMTRQNILFAGGILIAAMIAGALFATVILRPIASLSKTTKLISEGDLSARAPTGRGDELGQLMSRFNAMADRIEAQAEDLNRSNDELEHRVAERTAELVQKTEHLEIEISERKELEDQLRQSQKLDALGKLAGGIAHDFNNLLTAINGYSALVLRKLRPDDPVRGSILEIQKAGERAAALTAQLLAFSRKQVLKPQVHNLNAVIMETEKMLGRIIPENVEFQIVLDPQLGNINADPGQMEQVIMNLVVNARDAMPNGGRLMIETRNVYLDEDYVSQHIEIVPGPFIKLTVTDTGYGMDEQIKTRMFDPFFTTKEVGKGTGLGLSTVYGIVKQSGGDIMVYSEIDHGTTFKIYLPRVDKDVPIPEQVPEPESYAGTETILLVEDEDLVRNLTREILKDLGYEVLEASSGQDALIVCRNYPGDIHLLLTDMVMPGMSGLELKERLSGVCAAAKLLLMSGYTDDTLILGGRLNSEVAFIEKPFTPESLARKIREVLG